MRATDSARRRLPRWVRWLIALGVTLAVLATGAFIAGRFLLSSATRSVTQQDLLGKAQPVTVREHARVTGAKNILLVGVDARPGQDPSLMVRSDSIMIMHIAADHRTAYLVSLPRDSYVRIPAYDNGKSSYPGGRNKINAAFAFGGEGLTGAAAVSHGFELLALTVKRLTGITPDAGAIIDFQGFEHVVDVLGKVCMYVDEDTTSIHRGTDDKTGRPAAPYAINPDGTLNHKIAGVTPNFYAKGDHCFTPSQALDFVRQRDLLADHDFDYGRQRHQQQFLKAVLQQAAHEGLTSPTKLPSLLTAIGKTMTVDDGGISLDDWVFAMRNVDPATLVMIKTNGGQFDSRSIPGVGSVELLNGASMQLLQAVKADTIAAFLKTHPTWRAT